MLTDPLQNFLLAYFVCHLVDVVREENDAQASRYNCILKETRPLLLHVSLQPALLKLLGRKEAIAIAKEIVKAFKHSFNVPSLYGQLAFCSNQKKNFAEVPFSMWTFT